MISPQDQIQATLASLCRVFEDALVGVYLHGSAAMSELRPQSDIDLLVIIERPMTAAQRDLLLGFLLGTSGSHPAPPGGPRCLDIMVMLTSQLDTLQYPARAEFVYGEWLRPAFESGAPSTPICDPDITLVVAQAKHEARTLFGSSARVRLPAISFDQVRRAMRDALPSLVAGLDGDTRNVLLTLARMWRTVATGEFVSKDAAAAWAIAHMPVQEADTLARARAAYLGASDDAWATQSTAARRAAMFLLQRVADDDMASTQ